MKNNDPSKVIKARLLKPIEELRSAQETSRQQKSKHNLIAHSRPDVNTHPNNHTHGPVRDICPMLVVLIVGVPCSCSIQGIACSLAIQGVACLYAIQDALHIKIAL